MTDSGPRKSLWDLMGRKEPPVPPADAADPNHDDSPAPEASADAAAATSEPVVEPTLPARGLWALMQHGEAPAAKGPGGKVDRRLQQLSGSHAEAVPTGMEAVSEEVPATKPIDKRLRQLGDPQARADHSSESPEVDSAAIRRDRRLKQLEQPEVEVVNEDEDESVPPPPTGRVDRRLLQLAEPEVEIVDEVPDDLNADDFDFDEDAAEDLDQVESGYRFGRGEQHSARRDRSRAEDDEVDEAYDEEADAGLQTPAVVPQSLHRSLRGIPLPAGVGGPERSDDQADGRPDVVPEGAGAKFCEQSRAAIWSALLGLLSVPVSVVAIYPNLWSRFPPSVLGFSALLLGFLAQGETPRSRQKHRGAYLTYVGIASGLFGMFAGPLIYAPLDLYGQLCNSYTEQHLRQISLATEAYLQQHQSYPSGGVYRMQENGGDPEPMHGWMTLLLPHLPEGQMLARQIDLSKPYFDPANQSAMSQSLPTFLAAGGPSALVQGKFGPTHFAGVGGVVRLSDGSVAHAGVFDINSETTRDEVIDGLSQTLMAGEISHQYPAWGEPHNWRQIGKGLNRDPEGFGNARHTGAMFLMTDGSVRFILNKVDMKVLEAMSTRDGEDQPRDR